MNRGTSRLGAVLMAALLSACAGLPSAAPGEAARVRLASFELEGRASVRDGERSGTVAVQWAHDRHGERIDFLTPMGQVVARMQVGADEAVLELPGGERRVAASGDLLVEQALGLRLPLTRLAEWVQAVPGPSASVLRRDPAGRPALIAEDGWLVEYVSYADGSASAPPRRIEASWGELKVNLLIDAWQTE